MIRIGLTGSVGMGKSETAKMFAAEGIPVFDADAEVHRLYDVGGAAVPVINSAFPGVVVDGKVDRQRLANRVLNEPDELSRLEAIVHPLVERARANALRKAEADGASMILFDIPLLFEKDRISEVDVIIVVSAPEAVQRQRVLERPGMTVEKLQSILSRQTPDEEKRQRADFVIETDKGLDAARGQVKQIIDKLNNDTADK